MTEETPELTEEQRNAVAELPATSAQVGNELGISTDAAYHRLKRLSDSGAPLYQDEDDLWVWNGEVDLHRKKTHHVGTITRSLNNALTDDEAGIKSLLQDVEPVTAVQDPKYGNEDLVLFITDLHIGDLVTNDRDDITFDTEIALRRIRSIINSALKHKRRAEAHTWFDTCHLVLGGDLVTGNGIYDQQWEDLDHGIASDLKSQINTASEVLMWAIKTLAEEFKTLQVVSVPGNHGEMRASGASKEANADINVASRLEFGCRHTEYDNIHFQFHDSTSHTNFNLRGGEVKGHVRHGEECQEHAGATSASKRDWRGWRILHEPNFFLRGHYHEAKVERVMGTPIIMGGSVKPPGDFEESISVWGGPGAVMFGVSDEQSPTWMRFLEF